MYRVLLLILLALTAGTTSAQNRAIFVDGFDPPSFSQRFPLVSGSARLPPGPAANQIRWLMGELAMGKHTTPAQVAQHFIAGYDPGTIAAWINDTLRPAFADARIVDVPALTPYGGTVVIQGNIPANPLGYVSFQTHYTGDQKFTLLAISNWGGSVLYPEDQNLTLEQAMDKALTLASDVGVLVARVDPNGQCVPITQRNGSTLRATASIFKSWVLYAAGRMVVEGDLGALDLIPLAAERLALAGQLNDEPIGTPIPVVDLAEMMMGNSDNTATDLLHAHLGRSRVNAAVDASGVADPNVLKPLLSISEQFHLFFSFPLATAQTYVNASEVDQNQFLTDSIVPLGNYLGGGAYNNTSLLTSGSWRASALDICKVYSAMRYLPSGSEAFQTIDAALGASVALPSVRNVWDRVWYKGGSLSTSAGTFNVLTHAWLLENTDSPTYFVATLYNDNDPNQIDPYKVQSLAGRILELLALDQP